MQGNIFSFRYPYLTGQNPEGINLSLSVADTARKCGDGATETSFFLESDVTFDAKQFWQCLEAPRTSIPTFKRFLVIKSAYMFKLYS
eukprot:6383852-Amphidinium_carterae.1